MATLEYSTDRNGGFEVSFDSAALSAVVVEALMDEGLTHWLGNRAISNAIGAAKIIIGKEQKIKASEVTTAVFKTWRTSNASVYDTMLREIRDGIVAKIRAGEVPFERSGGGGSRETITPLVREMRRIAEAELVAMFATKGLELPSASGKINMAGKDYTRLDLIKLRVGNPAHADRLKSEAERALAALERSAQRNSAVEGDFAELLGLGVAA